MMRLILQPARVKAMLILIALMAGAPGITAFDSETISVFGEDCSAQKTSFNLGDSVCAQATGSPLGPPVQRRFAWIAPDGTIFHSGPDIVSDPQINSITIPASGPYAQVGTWAVKTVDVSNNGFAVAQFIVQDANKAAADLSANMFGPFQTSAGASITFTLIVKNSGPNEAHNVQIKIGTASNSTLLSAEQTAGLPFTWIVAPQSANGTGICSIATLPINAEASFAFSYQVEPGTPNGATIASTAQISSSTFELYPTDNVGTATCLITPQPCAVSCPGNISAPKQAGQCGAVISFAAPVATGSNCGALACNPASGSFFPVGTTPVTCVGKSGMPCSFTVTVGDSLPPALTCASDIIVTENSPGMGLAVVKYKLPTMNDNCAADTSACAPPSGSSFPLGITTVNCETSNDRGDRATCSFTVTVDSSDCSLICPAGIARSNKPNECGAVINYPAPKSDGNCGAITCAPPSGAFFPIGATTVSCSSAGGASGTFQVTVQDTQGPAITSISASPSTLSLLDSKMRNVTISYDASDNCPGEITCSLDVSSNEPVSSAGDKDTAPDWEIVDAHHLRLRAERSAKGQGRIYTITITCTDSNGNSSVKTVTVSAPRNQH